MISRRCAVVLALLFFTAIAESSAAVEVFLPSQPDVSPDGKTIVFAWRALLTACTRQAARPPSSTRATI